MINKGKDNIKNPYNTLYDDKNSNIKNEFVKKLPPPTLLESYDELSHGLSHKVLKILHNEQNLRYKSNQEYCRIMKNAIFCGQMLSTFLAILTICVTALLAIKYNMEIAGAALCISSFTFLAIIIIFLMKRANWIAKFTNTGMDKEFENNYDREVKKGKTINNTQYEKQHYTATGRGFYTNSKNPRKQKKSYNNTNYNSTINNNVADTTIDNKENANKEEKNFEKFLENQEKRQNTIPIEKTSTEKEKTPEFDHKKQSIKHNFARKRNKEIAS